MPKKRRKRKRWAILAVAILVLIVGSNLLRGGDSVGVEIDPLKMEEGDVVRRLAESGSIEMDRTVDVKSQVAGRIIRLYADVGDSISAGELLAIIEPDPNKALQLTGKRAAVKLAEMEFVEQQRQLGQKRLNYQDGIIAKEEIDRAEYSFIVAESRLTQQRMELQILEREVRTQASTVRTTSDSLHLEDYEIVSPMNGIVIDRPVEEGELVTSAVSVNQGTILFRVGDPNELIVKVMISEIDIGEARAGLEAEIKVDAIPGEVFPGLLRHVAPTGNVSQGSMVVSFNAEVEVVGAFSQLRHGMSADVDIIIRRALGVLYLPIEGVAEVYKLDEDGKETVEVERRIVFVKNGDEWEEREVETGLESNTRIVILGGLEPDEEVHPDAQIEWERRSGRERADPGDINLLRRGRGRR